MNQQEQIVDSFLENIHNLNHTVAQLDKHKNRISQNAVNIIENMKEVCATLKKGITPIGESAISDRLNISINPPEITQSTDKLLELLKDLSQATNDAEVIQLLNVLDDHMAKATINLMYLQK